MSRGLRKARVSSSCWGRFLRILLVAVCALSIAGGMILAREFSSLRWEDGAGILHARTGVSGRKLSGGEVLKAKSDARSALPFLDATEKELQESAVEPLQSDADSVLERAKRRLVSRIGFGSCTSRVAIDQHIWVNSIIPSDVDAWIWAGDIAYTDWPDVNCAANPSHIHCNCTRNWLRSNPDSCLAGDVAHARLKFEEQLSNLDYSKFVDFMCSTSKNNSWRSLDLSLCDRPILGTWDDHDYNWQDGDKRMPTKEEQKQLYLDALGVPRNSPRRSNGRGIYWRHTLNEGVAGKEIDVLLLDERFHRDTKPCHTRRDFCNFTNPKKTKYMWCKDFLEGGAAGTGSCCKKDDQFWQGWCRILENRANPLWNQVCNPKSPLYGFVDANIEMIHNNSINEVFAWSILNQVDATSDLSVLCEILGPQQRRWLRHELENSQAVLKLVVSGSPLISNPTEFVCSQARKKHPAAYCKCYDDFDCFQPAQRNLLHMFTTAPGCVVVLTGDFHFSDIKILQPGNRRYSNDYGSTDLPRPLVQVMASGLTNNTAAPAACEGFRIDKVGLRPNGACDFVSGPAFGLIEVDWDILPPRARLQIRGDDGQVLLEQKLSLDSCVPVS
ncbi:hypothetical protein M758_5G198700 [Ceratodon purpureus]|uniref:PhoD-like phosphatase metallophosphatase domain-containing protein n=1 Tax=Ceratodon purpureus TaxID=3225 RepID=A0A8T0I3N5_CERPU|nr:hypothetical protein KC19_5G205000 [Ceratodon purpureus]KAG0617558.1 hypothetical protein M758_5G198700 [Ceratodon purpureus]